MSRLIDFTRTYWGHNFETWENYGDGSYKIVCWCSPSPKPGDLVRWKTEYGYADFHVSSVKTEFNVVDMHWLEVRVQKRYNTKGEVIG